MIIPVKPEWRALHIQLSSPVVSARVEAVRRLGMTSDPWVLQLFPAVLQDPDPEVRRTGVEVLGQIGNLEAVELLLEALRNRDPEVQAMAAERLGQWGKSGVVGPLGTSLRRQLRAVSFWRWANLAVVMTGVLLVTLDVRNLIGFGPLVLFYIPVFTGAVSATSNAASRGNSRVARVCKALTQVTERDPSLASRAILAELQRIGRNRLLYGAEAHRISQDAARRIEDLTAHIRSYPIPGEGAAPDPAGLPLPADSLPPGEHDP